MASRAVPIVGQVLLAIDGLGTLIQAVAPKEYKEFNQGVRGAAGSVVSSTSTVVFSSAIC